eukprot:826162_1
MWPMYCVCAMSCVMASMSLYLPFSLALRILTKKCKEKRVCNRLRRIGRRRRYSEAFVINSTPPTKRLKTQLLQTLTPAPSKVCTKKDEMIWGVRNATPILNAK